ncbi:3-isopropylmalate dehydratase small subunit [Loigolactobacillus jiayinensis]|uniref:3-isopropylmalate dehydratase small subunit n=1 Tax=Loigolactobacillus jiayinensis TaxID=2486016 RepID=A0ABW1RL41_9LACO|nr:3-isopropylmalate dehydratase small subunit [Loigolactobacillus jiayinensis]
MEPIKTISSHIVPVMDDNIDTDQLISRDSLKEVAKASFADMLFYGQRYLASGAKNPAFPLNDPQRAGAQILITGHNFGCGSAWEHAAWALRDYGFRAVIAKDFNDIFYMNSIKSGVLPIELTDAQCELLAALPATAQVTVDLPQQTVTSAGQTFKFKIDPLWKSKLATGTSDIELTSEFNTQIDQFEQDNN